MTVRAGPVSLGPLVEPDLERLGAFRRRHEADEPFPFLGQSVAVLLRQGLERFDLQGEVERG